MQTKNIRGEIVYRIKRCYVLTLEGQRFWVTEYTAHTHTHTHTHTLKHAPKTQGSFTVNHFMGVLG